MICNEKKSKKVLDKKNNGVKLVGSSQMDENFRKRIMDDISWIISTPLFPEDQWELVFNFLLPFPPTTGNHRCGINKGRKKVYYLKKEIQQYYHTVWATTLPLRKAQNIHELDGTLGAFVYYIMPDKRKRDADNLTKVIFDSLEYAEVVKDDSLLNRRTAFIVDENVDKDNACAIVLIFKKRS